MRFDTEWGRKACSPAKRVVRNIIVWVSSIASVLTLLLLLIGLFIYESPGAAAVVLGVCISYTLGTMFINWISNDGCEEDNEREGFS